jgi:hypothetical protein
VPKEALLESEASLFAFSLFRSLFFPVLPCSVPPYQYLSTTIVLSIHFHSHFPRLDCTTIDTARAEAGVGG